MTDRQEFEITMKWIGLVLRSAFTADGVTTLIYSTPNLPDTGRIGRIGNRCYYNRNLHSEAKFNADGSIIESYLADM